MIITAVEPIRLLIPLPATPPCDLPLPAGSALPVHMVRVTAEGGATGWGEAQPGDWQQLCAAVDLFTPVLVGQRAVDRGALWERMVDRIRRQAEQLPAAATALSALDQALWHLAGVAVGLPVYQLLGGKRVAMLDTYASGLQLEPTTELLRRAEALLERGFRALQVRLSGNPGQDLEPLQALKSAIGPQTRLMAHLGQAWRDRDEALRASRDLDRLELFWLAEPLPVEDWSHHVALRHALDTALAAGETARTPGQFRAAFVAGAVDIATPDLRLCGGITGLLKIADMARWFGVQVSPAACCCPIALMAAAHAAATLSNCQLIGLHTACGEIFRGLLTPGPQLRDGFLVLPEEPGLGVMVDAGWIARHRAQS